MSRLRLEDIEMSAAHLESRKDYEQQLGAVQRQLLHIQQTYFHERRRAILVFEGWDAAGKGGCIRRLTEQLDPRGYHVWPIGAPTPDEQGRHYLYRFWQRLPEPGTIAIFDRSWYGRVLVERIEGLATEPAWRRAYREINEFERMLTADGVRIVKLFLHITPEEQLERFRERLINPYKRWKLTAEDLRNRARWDDYVAAIDAMFDHTSTAEAAWHPIAANSKWYARVTVLSTIAAELKRDVTISPPPIDPDLQQEAARLLGLRLTAPRNH